MGRIRRIDALENRLANWFRAWCNAAMNLHSLFRWMIPVALSCGHAMAAESVIKDSQGMDCHVYVPDAISPATTYQLVVGVHGAGGRGNGAAGMKDWAKRGDVIVIGPSFETKGERPYQNGDGVHAQKLIDLFRTLGKTYKLRDRMFLHGFSGGSQFVHRFAMANPELVCGVSAHSGGTWATDNYGEITKAARKIPFAISCGEKDVGFAFAGSPYNRLDWYKRFEGEIDKMDFCYIGGTWPDVGHSMSAGAWDLCRQCFQLATGLPGASATESVTIAEGWKNLKALPGKPALAKTAPKPEVRPAVAEAEVDQMARAAFKRADAETVPDHLLIGFMKKYPPALWKDKPGSAKLLAQCTSAAGRWHEAAKRKGMTPTWKDEFARFSEGLDLPVTE